MEEKEEALLAELESEGKQIAKYRKKLINLINSGKKINSSRLTIICECMNQHIGAFDKISAELTVIEAIN